MKRNATLILLGLLCASASVLAADAALPDPTRPDLGEVKPVIQPKEKTIKPKKARIDKGLRLEQTVVSHNRRFAVINGKQYHLGSKLRGARVSKIESNYVLLDNFGEIYRLDLVPELNITEAAGK